MHFQDLLRHVDLKSTSGHTSCMDNLTHTLIGATTAKALPARWRKNSTFWALVIGNNLPDCDFIYSLLPGISGLDYLVHHRGYTHSFFSIFALALPGAWLASKLGRTGFDRQIYLFTLLGCFMHIGADETVELGREVFWRDVAAAERFLSRAPYGTRVVTYCGWGGSMPKDYELVLRERCAGLLELWRKTPRARVR